MTHTDRSVPAKGVVEDLRGDLATMADGERQFWTAKLAPLLDALESLTRDLEEERIKVGELTEGAMRLNARIEEKDRELAEARERISVLEALTDTPLFSHRALTAKLHEIVATRFGARFMDPPDGGDVPASDQVERMADALLAAERSRDEALEALRVERERGRAASDLLDACKRSSEILRGRGAPDWCVAKDILNEAIAKAEGNGR